MTTSRIDRLRRLVQQDLDALPDQPTLPSSGSDGAGDDVVSFPPPSDPSKHPDTDTNPTAEPVGECRERMTSLSLDPGNGSHSADMAIKASTAPPAPPLPPCDMQCGDLTSTHAQFMPIAALSKYPFEYCSKEYQQSIASAFYHDGKFWLRSWDLYYIWGVDETSPLILVSEDQVLGFLSEINAHLGLGLKITTEQRQDKLVTSFPNHPRCRPRYLGRSYSRQEYLDMVQNVPDSAHRAAGEGDFSALGGPTLEEFKELMQKVKDVQTAAKAVNKERRREGQLMKQKFMTDQFKRAQRYLGLRSSTALAPGQDAPSEPAFDPSKPAPYKFDQDVVFVCVDVESYEMAHHKITEVGIATLDTRQLVGVAPGENGANWRSLICARHFRIQEHAHLVNGRHVAGHPDGFLFGESTFISIKDAANNVDVCFRPPFGLDLTDPNNFETIIRDLNTNEQRNVILLGHDTKGDIKYLQQLGYDPMKNANILEAQDTAVMYRVWRRERNPTNLGKILASLDISAWRLHNAGNDAVYTVQAMLGICVREASLRGTSELEKMREDAQTARLYQATEEAIQRIHDEAEDWDHAEDNGNGGAPISLYNDQNLVVGDASRAPSTKTQGQAAGRGSGGGRARGNGGGRGRGRGNGRGGNAAPTTAPGTVPKYYW